MVREHTTSCDPAGGELGGKYPTDPSPALHFCQCPSAAEANQPPGLAQNSEGWKVDLEKQTISSTHPNPRYCLLLPQPPNS